jgi:50S ribosomal subunit-associated GTPase HflX
MNTILREIDAEGQVIVCANKIDCVDDDALAEALEVIHKSFLGSALVPISALTGENLDELYAQTTAKIKEARSIKKVPALRYQQNTQSPSEPLAQYQNRPQQGGW